MKGVVLAGGLGTRLYPLTKITNKHLLPIYNKPMIYYPIQTLVDAGINEVILVTGGNYAGDFLRLLGNGREFGLKRLSYVYQEGEGGIAAALSLTEQFVDNDKIIVILGDNLIEKTIVSGVEKFKKMENGALIYLKDVPDPERFGVAEICNGEIASIQEKPKNPKSNHAVIGIYMYDNQVFSIIKTLAPSSRGELEITDVNSVYLSKHQLSYAIIEGWWTDAGTFESLFEANCLIQKKYCERKLK